MEQKSRVLQSGEEVNMLTEKKINTGEKVPMAKVKDAHLQNSIELLPHQG
jgi:hypothetical protein